MGECEVRENCKNYITEQDCCWYCEDYQLYLPESKKIKSPRQERKKLEKQAEKERKADLSKMGKKSKKKGSQGELEVVKLLCKHKIEAEKVPLSGMLKSQKYSCDVLLTGLDKRAEIKRRKDGIATVEKWLQEDVNVNYVFFREDHGKWKVIMYLEEFLDLAGEKGEGNL